MIATPPPLDPSVVRTLSPAPVGRRFGAMLLDSAFILLLVFSGSELLGFTPQTASPLVFAAALTAYQVCVIAFALGKDSWWPGRGLGKRVATVLVAKYQTNRPASRLRCVWRQTIFSLIFFAVYLPVYLYPLHTIEVIRMAVASSLGSAAAPVRLVEYLVPERANVAGRIVYAHWLALGFILLEGLLIMSRPDRRRIVDLLAGTQVVDAKSSAPAS